VQVRLGENSTVEGELEERVEKEERVARVEKVARSSRLGQSVQESSGRKERPDEE
jgi:hypothetical protein